MQQFVIPQFIDKEDKILGPITVRQFIIVLVTTLILAVTYRLLDFTGFILSFLFIGGSGIVLAFVKVNGREFHYFILNIAQIILRPSLRVWKHDVATAKKATPETNKAKDVAVTKVVRPKQVSSSRLSELSLLIDTGGRYTPEPGVVKRPEPQPVPTTPKQVPTK